MLDDNTVGKLFRSNFGWQVLVDLAAIGNRLAGSEGELKAAKRIANAFREAGLREVKINEFPIQGWSRGPAELMITTPVRESYSAIGLPRSPTGTVNAQLVNVGHGLPEDFERVDLKGKIVLASSTVPDDYPRRIHRMEKYQRAADRGAAGFIFHNHIPGQLMVTGSVGLKGELGRIPAVGISMETGAWLSRLCAESEVSCSLGVEAGVDPATCSVVEGVTGPEDGKEVLVSCHHDAHDIGQGAIDDGSGTAILCDIAHALSGLKLESRVRFVTFGGEEVGLEGAKWWSENKGVDNIKAVVNNDFFHGDLLMLTFGFDGLAKTVAEVSKEYNRPINQTSKKYGYWTYGDHWHFVRRGVPSIFARAETGRWRGWGHTSADTLDKVSLRDLRDFAILIASVIEKLTEKKREISPRKAEDVVKELDEMGFMLGMQAWT